MAMRVGEFAQHLNLAVRVFRAEHCGARDEVVGTGLGRSLNGRAGNAAVDLDRDLKPCGINRRTRSLNLRNHLFDEGLSAETRLNRHDENHVEFVQDVHEGRDIGCWFQRKAGARTDAVQLACEAQWCRSCLSVEGDGLAADLRVLRRPAIRILDHEVCVNRQDAGLYDGFCDGQTPREVGDEMVVHDVDGLIVAFITHMLAPAQASHKHKIRTETVVPQLQRTAVVALDDTRRGRYIQRLGCAFVSQCDGVKQLDLTAFQ